MKRKNKCPYCGRKTVFNKAMLIHVCQCGFMGYIKAPVNNSV